MFLLFRAMFNSFGNERRRHGADQGTVIWLESHLAATGSICFLQSTIR